MHGVDYIFHAVALKQLLSREFSPMEAVRTNVIGTDNVLTAAIEEALRRLSVFLPTNITFVFDDGTVLASELRQNIEEGIHDARNEI